MLERSSAMSDGDYPLGPLRHCEGHDDLNHEGYLGRSEGVCDDCLWSRCGTCHELKNWLEECRYCGNMECVDGLRTCADNGHYEWDPNNYYLYLGGQMYPWQDDFKPELIK